MREQIHLVILFGALGGFTLIVGIPILVNIDFFGGGQGCQVDSRPIAPVLLSVTQDPVTLVVTATARDESDNEQWFSLGRTIINRNNQVVSVGTDVEVPENDELRVSKDVGRTVTIMERTTVQILNPIPGQTYVYTVRALNCFAESPRSNDITIVALSPA